MIVPGTAKMPRYAQGDGTPRDYNRGLLGIQSYGRSVVDGYAGCYKVGRDDAGRVSAIGYLIVKTGTGYSYAWKATK